MVFQACLHLMPALFTRLAAGGCFVRNNCQSPAVGAGVGGPAPPVPVCMWSSICIPTSDVVDAYRSEVSATRSDRNVG